MTGRRRLVQASGPAAARRQTPRLRHRRGYVAYAASLNAQIKTNRMKLRAHNVQAHRLFREFMLALQGLSMESSSDENWSASHTHCLRLGLCYVRWV